MVGFDYSGESTDSSDNGRCPLVINALLRRFLRDEVLREAYNAVARATQSYREDEEKFAERLLRAAPLCRHVFRKDERVKFYVQRLRTAIREIVSQ